MLEWRGLKRAFFDDIPAAYLKTKPFAVGMKKANGGQHWVLVTGFTGGNSLSASNFIINDPASTKTKLSDVIANYPYFYKIAYYK